MVYDNGPVGELAYARIFLYYQKAAAGSMVAQVLSETDLLADRSDAIWRHIVLWRPGISNLRQTILSLAASFFFCTPFLNSHCALTPRSQPRA